MVAAVTSGTRSHRRGAAVRDGVLSAALNELLNVGIEGVTVASVAQAAGVHVTSVYRRWKTREQLILAAVLNHLDTNATTAPDTGNLRDDLMGTLINLRDNVLSAQGRALIHIAMMPVGVDHFRDVRSALLADQVAIVREVIDRAIQRGECASDADPALIQDTLYAPIFARVLLTRQQVDEEYLNNLVDLFLQGIAIRPN